jgi:iron(III) transport system permease protein
MSRSFARIVLAVTTVFFAAFFLWPIWQILQGRLRRRRRPAHLRLPRLAAHRIRSISAACATPSCSRSPRHRFALLLALPLAFVADRFVFPARAWLGSLVLVPMILPPFVGAIGIKQIFGQYGALNALLIATSACARPAGRSTGSPPSQFWGVALVEAFSLYPIIYLNAVAALANIDPAMEEAAAELGCTGFAASGKITLPLIKPGLFAGGTIVFIWAFTELGVPLIFDYNRVTAVQIYYGLKDIGGNPFPYALVAVMLASSVALYAVGKGCSAARATR